MTTWQTFAPAVAGLRGSAVIELPPEAPSADCVDPQMWRDARMLLVEHLPVGGVCPRCATAQCGLADLAAVGLDTAQGVEGPKSSYWTGLAMGRDRESVRLLAGPMTDAAEVHPSLPSYLSEVEAHCPLLAAARARGHLLLSCYQPGYGAAAGVFAAVCAAAEDVRVRRRDAGALACAVLAFVGPAVVGGADDLVSFPAWVARWLYAGAGLMVNAFEPGGARPSRHGRLIPAPDVALVVVRAGVPDVDVELQGDLAGQELVPARTDDGHDVFARVLGTPTETLAARAAFRELTVLSVASAAARRRPHHQACDGGGTARSQPAYAASG